MIDAHLHFVGDHPDAIALLEEFDLKMFNITVAHKDKPWREREVVHYRRLAREMPDRFAWCTSFDPPSTSNENPEYTNRVIEGLERDFADGAIACKVWKNVGMECQDEEGRYIMPDDPVLEPICKYLEDKGVTLLMHIAEPLACWQPLDWDSPHQGYYKKNPQWHMFGRDDVPSHAQLMAARDRIIERHPNLRVVGAHLASLEYDLNEIASRFAKYDNFAVDTSARLMDLANHRREDVREFFFTYSDRILFGTDIVARESHSQMGDHLRKERYQNFYHNYRTQRAYFGTAEPVELRNEKYTGLDLPDDVLRAFFIDNARLWYPDL